MNAGLQILNDSGVIQITQDFKNLELKSSGTINCTVFGASIQPGEFPYPWTPPNLKRGILEVSGTTPILAIYNPDSSHWTTVCRRPTTTPGVFSFAVFVAKPVDSDQTVQYFLFDQPTASGGTIGLQVFTAAGELAFDSQKKYMRVLGSFNGIYQPGDPMFSGAYDEPLLSASYPGRTVAVVHNMNAFGRSNERDYIVFRCIQCTATRQLSPGSVGMTMKHYMQRDSGAPAGETMIGGSGYNALLVDVTGF